MIKAVVFDVDGVLIDSFDANLKFFQDLLTKAGYSPPTKEKYLPIFHLSMLDVIKHLTKLSSNEKINRVWEMGRSPEFKYPNHLLKPQKNLRKTIRKLNDEYLMGIVTNRIKEGIYKIPVVSKLQKYFQTIISWEDTINHKPHPEPLILACKKLNVMPAEAVYIGDAETDLIAGKAAGMKVIYFSQKKHENADATTLEFEKLPELIKSLK